MALHVRATLISTLFLAVINTSTDGKLIARNREQVDNGINNAPPPRISGITKDFIKISQAPPEVKNAKYGDRVEIECVVLGSPSPEIRWLQGTKVVQKTERINNNHSTVPGGYHARAGLAKITSRLVIDCATSEHQGYYTCEAEAGSKKIQSAPSLILIEGENSNVCNEMEQPQLLKPRIVTWNPTAMENIGVDVLLPCAAEGNPTPKIHWLDHEGKVVENYRFQTLSNGDLAIYSLSWDDMGQYTCVAGNSLGTDTVTTFIYPLLN